jgi:hypothetical protein
MIVGFTGTRKGMTDAQKATVAVILENLKNENNVALAHHGDCLGADAEFHALAKAAGYKTVGHPCDISNQRAYCQVDECMEVKRPLIRNRDIVNYSTVLIACPKGSKEEVRSGTWATIRFARRINWPLLLVFPDGRVEKPVFIVVGKEDDENVPLKYEDEQEVFKDRSIAWKHIESAVAFLQTSLDLSGIAFEEIEGFDCKGDYKGVWMKNRGVSLKFILIEVPS